MSEWIDIGAVEDVPVLGSRVVQAPGGDIAVFKAADGTLFALRDPAGAGNQLAARWSFHPAGGSSWHATPAIGSAVFRSGWARR